MRHTLLVSLTLLSLLCFFSCSTTSPQEGVESPQSTIPAGQMRVLGAY